MSCLQPEFLANNVCYQTFKTKPLHLLISDFFLKDIHIW